MVSWPASVSVALLITALCSGCMTTTSSAFSRARAAGVANFVDFPMRAAKCERADFGTYSAPELRELATLYPFQSRAEISAEEGGRLSCGFDRPEEYCSWTTSGVNGGGFQKARFETFFDFEKFDCTSERSFAFDEYFLLAGGEEGVMQTAVLEVEVPCQLGTSTVQFDYWSNSESATVKACTVAGSGGDPSCAELSLEPNPLMFEVPQNIAPFKIRIEVANLTPDNIVLIDNVAFKGQICEVVPEESEIERIGASTVPLLPTTIPSFVSSTTNFVQIPEPAESGAHPTLVSSVPTSRSPLLQQPIVDDSAIHQEVDSDAVLENDFDLTEPANDFEICDSLQCNFNANDACFYNPTGLGSTSEWRLGNGHLGNRHTGVRQNPNDPSNGGFLYVGKEHFDQSGDVFVLESVKFGLREPVVLVFDVYQRSYGPRLKVCLNTFDNCPYTNPPIRASEWWFRDQEVIVEKSAQKVYFVADKISANLYLAIDNLRLRSAADNRPLCSRAR